MVDNALSRLFAEEVPGGSGPHCLMVHGFLSSRAQFRDNLSDLSEVCRPVLVELWGHGRSPAPRDVGMYSVSSYIEQFESLRESLGVQQWFVFGQSLGAGLALHYAAACPAAVLGVILTNSMSAFSQPEDVARRGAKPLIMVLESGGEAARRMLETLPVHVSHARRLPEGVRRELLADAERLDPHAVAQGIRRTLSEVSALAILRDVIVPALLLNGTYERSFQDIRNGLAAVFPALQIIDLEAGHAVNAEVPQATNTAVGKFIRMHADGGAVRLRDPQLRDCAGATDVGEST